MYTQHHNLYHKHGWNAFTNSQNSISRDILKLQSQHDLRLKILELGIECGMKFS